jgi:starch synthase (maltosyl-transferring)
MAPKIYHLHPVVAGRLADWPRHFARCRSMGCDVVLLAPPFRPGASGDIFLTADHDALHPALDWDGDADAGLSHAADMAAKAGLRLWLDLAVDRVAIDAGIRDRESEWFGAGGCGAPPSPWRSSYRLDAAYAQLERTDVADAFGEWWLERLRRWREAGIAGFRSLEPDRVPAGLWRRLIGAAPDCRFLAWTPGINRAALPQLEGIGFHHSCSSVAWWDGRGEWLVQEMAALRRIAPPIASPEPSFTERRALQADAAASYRMALHLAAATADGILLPMGFEFATRLPFDAARGTPADFEHARETAPCDLSDDIRKTNALVESIAALGVGGEMRQLTPASAPATALLRADAADVREASHAVVVLINPDVSRTAEPTLPLAPLPPRAGAAFDMPRPIDGAEITGMLAPGEVRVLAYQVARPVARRTVDRDPPTAGARIAIEAVSPAVPDDALPVKRLVGESVTIGADIITDGHELLAAELLWRAGDETTWQRAPMRPTGNDRWEGSFALSRVGRHCFCIEAWWDVWGTFCHDIAAKHGAGQSVKLEIEEGRQMLRAALARSGEGCAVETALRRLDTTDETAAVSVLLSPELQLRMRAIDGRKFAVRHPPIEVMADRPQAGFASWYEMFPRSATDDPARHGTFTDVIRRLPAIRAMGFDVLYFPPIHPIGKTNRKGRNNALRAEPGDVGSPYAIGGTEGGHDAIHPELGTLEDFRALIAAAHEHGLEIALDFAIQCSPDHPWLAEHPDWFRWRPDGSIRFAENPPKKYEDIVNPDFYAEAAMPGLWLALRDVVQFWVDQGVRIFRVDNPHTKPLPFWQWMIGDITARHPDVIFLAEAFTRPKVMYRLAKIGFTQSYTYFTWRNTKQEIVDYLTELNAPPQRDFFRPNFFVNTPDINPPFLQTSGRAGFLIRAALACTLSGLWGMYSGFEVCEAAPLPGREEYLDSEKYQIRVRDFAAPGNIVSEIATLNRIRRMHPALQTHLGITFYQALNDQVLLYGKGLASEEKLLIAVSLDPHAPQEAAIEVPLWEFGLPDDGALAVIDLLRGHRFVWHGKHQRIRLDPADLPFAIWQIGGA